MLNVRDACVKSDINENVPLSMSEYLNKTSIEIFCSRYGVPYNGTLEMKLDTRCPVNSDAIDAYSSNPVTHDSTTTPGIETQFDSFIETVNKMGPVEKKKYVTAYGDGTNITRQTIIDKVYQGTTKFQHIKDVSDDLIQNRI